jgi:hypothetical protein
MFGIGIGIGIGIGFGFARPAFNKQQLLAVACLPISCRLGLKF